MFQAYLSVRTPVGDDEKEIHRNSMRREMDTALKLSQLAGDNSLMNDSCDSIETPVMGRKQVNVDVEPEVSDHESLVTETYF